MKRFTKRFTWKKRLGTILATALLAASSAMSVFAEEDTKMVVRFDADTYEAGSVATAQVYIYNAEFNAAGFSLTYDTEAMTPVLADGSTSDVAGQLISIEGKYDEDEGAGTFSVLSTDVDKADGTVEALLYVNPNVGKTASADSNGLLIGEISFLMEEGGTPEISFATNADSVDFYAVPCLILNNGAQMEVAYADVKAGDTTVQNVDVSKEVIDKKDKEIRESEEAAKGTSGQSTDSNDESQAAAVGESANSAGTVDGQAAESGSTNSGEVSTDSTGPSSTLESDAGENGMNSQNGQVKMVLTISIVAGVILLVPILVVIICKKKKNRR